MQTPNVSLNVLGTMLYASVTAYAAIKLVIAIRKGKKKKPVSKAKMVVNALLLALMTLLFLNENLIAISSNLILGGAFVGIAYFNMRRFIDASRKKLKRAWILLPNAFIFLLFGIVALVTADSVDTSFIFYVGNYLAIAGIGDLFGAVYDNIQDKRADDLD